MCICFWDSGYTPWKCAAKGFTQNINGCWIQQCNAKAFCRKSLQTNTPLHITKIEWPILQKVHNFSHTTLDEQNASNHLMSWNSSFIAALKLQLVAWFCSIVSHVHWIQTWQGSCAKGQRDQEPAVLSPIYLEKIETMKSLTISSKINPNFNIKCIPSIKLT